MDSHSGYYPSPTSSRDGTRRPKIPLIDSPSNHLRIIQCAILKHQYFGHINKKLLSYTYQAVETLTHLGTPSNLIEMTTRLEYACALPSGLAQHTTNVGKESPYIPPKQPWLLEGSGMATGLTDRWARRGVPPDKMRS